MIQTQVPLVYTADSAYNVMVSADYYVDGNPRRDSNISAAGMDLYMAPMPHQAAAVMDFLQKNADKFTEDLSTQFSSFDYNGGRYARDFEQGQHAQFRAEMKEGREVGGHVDAQHLVVYSRPNHVRRVKFVEVAFMRPVLPDNLRSQIGRVRRDQEAGLARRDGAAGGTFGAMHSLLETI